VSGLGRSQIQNENQKKTTTKHIHKRKKQEMKEDIEIAGRKHTSMLDW
jgi:hypothetical protein